MTMLADLAASVQAFDHAVIVALNAQAHALEAQRLDLAMRGVANLQIIKGGVLVALLWAVWFSSRDAAAAGRRLVLRIILGGVAAVAVGRLLQLLLPARLRPMADPDLAFALPTYVDASTLDGWSSLPSDHAVLSFALAAGVFAADRRLGLAAILWTAVVICMPRIYLGYHYPSDIVAGGVVGILLMMAVLRMPTSWLPLDHALAFERRLPGVFYAVAFLATWQVAVMGDDVRHVLRGLVLAMGHPS